MERVYRKCCMARLLMPILLIFTALLLIGCSTPQINFKKESDGHISISVEPGKILGIIPYGGSLPKGDYSCEFGKETSKASADTKVDLKLIEANLSKISEN